jgi:hypothetical protein
LERQDIDALLVGALYGELTPADEARLAMHLESHPGDRTALADLKVARSAVRESRIFEVQLDPPQAVSALLLQEAARRAPKLVVRDDSKAESWFQRFVRSFIAHPAMAAAATLVLVVGVAGTIYLKKGDAQLAEPTVANTERGQGAASTPPALAVVASDAGAVEIAADNDQVKVALADGDKQPAVTAPVATPSDSRAKQVAQHAAGNVAGPQRNGMLAFDGKAGKDVAKADPRPAKPTAATTPAPPKNESRRYVEVQTADPQPKDLPDDTGTTSGTATIAKGEAAGNYHAGLVPGGGGATGSVAPQPQPPRTSAAAPPPPPSQGPIEKTKVADSPKPADKTVTKEDTLLAWAKDQHARVISLVKQGKCADAAPSAVAIKNRAPDYYNAYVVTDRQIKQCMQYINDAAEKDAERSAKSRPAKRADLKEPAPAPAEATHK